MRLQKLFFPFQNPIPLPRSAGGCVLSLFLTAWHQAKQQVAGLSQGRITASASLQNPLSVNNLFGSPSLLTRGRREGKGAGKQAQNDRRVFLFRLGLILQQICAVQFAPCSFFHFLV